MKRLRDFFKTLYNIRAELRELSADKASNTKFNEAVYRLRVEDDSIIDSTNNKLSELEERLTAKFKTQLDKVSRKLDEVAIR